MAEDIKIFKGINIDAAAARQQAKEIILVYRQAAARFCQLWTMHILDHSCSIH